MPLKDFLLKRDLPGSAGIADFHAGFVETPHINKESWPCYQRKRGNGYPPVSSNVAMENSEKKKTSGKRLHSC